MYRCLSSLRSGVWSVVSLLARPFLHIIARLSPTLPTTSSIPSRSNATVAVVPAVRKEAGEEERDEELMNLCVVAFLWTQFIVLMVLCSQLFTIVEVAQVCVQSFVGV